MPEIAPQQSLTVANSKAAANLAKMCGIDAREVAAVLQNMIMPEANGAEMIAFAHVCVAYNLDPLKKQIYAFKNKMTDVWGAGLYVDGWITCINRHPDFAGMEISEQRNKDTGKPYSVTVTIHTKSRPQYPTVVTEYYDECKGSTGPWQQWPTRMLRHRGIIQAGRVAFGFPGLAVMEDQLEGRDASLARASEASRSNVAALNRALDAIDVEATVVASKAIESQCEPERTPEPEPEPSPAKTEEPEIPKPTGKSRGGRRAAPPKADPPQPAPAPAADDDDEFCRSLLGDGV